MNAQTKTTKEFSEVIEADEGTDFSQSLTIQMDERSVLEMIQFDDTGAADAYMVLSLQQASNLHKILGQMLIAHARSWGVKMLPYNGA